MQVTGAVRARGLAGRVLSLQLCITLFLETKHYLPLKGECCKSTGRQYYSLLPCCGSLDSESVGRSSPAQKLLCNARSSMYSAACTSVPLLKAECYLG